MLQFLRRPQPHDSHDYRRTRSGATIALLGADTPPPPGGAPRVDAADHERVAARRAQAKAANTVRGYAAFLAAVERLVRGAPPLPVHPGLAGTTPTRPRPIWPRRPTW
ncbi:hypothetical protein ACQP1O_22410 [Nocardia sp. CA-151230]|uniref:hypothetical protein n=1 Tax=Nocardia sp. CA-151230 TaxID=3239982 RepID=UPI003D909AA6